MRFDRPIVLIETYWNVNLSSEGRKYIRSSINRNILECKWYIQGMCCRRIPVLIETYWNVNLFACITLHPEFFVLIETYWNVNWIRPGTPVSRGLVLIETYWNVNSIRKGRRTAPVPHRINRNILECKLHIAISSAYLPTVLIETYWNVNILICQQHKTVLHVLIETYWNVNKADYTVAAIRMTY